MDLLTKGVLIKDLENIDIFSIRVTDLKYSIIRLKMLEQKQIGTDLTNQLLDEGKIKSVSRPKNKSIQKELDRLGLAKRTIKKTLQEMYDFFK